MELLHETVRHARFGRGTITAFDGHTLAVSFEEGDEKTFSWPAAFERFLEADNPDVRSEAEALLRDKREANADNLNRIEQDIASLRAANRKPPAPKRAPRKKPIPSKARI
jgi:hypothetical protein